MVMTSKGSLKKRIPILENPYPFLENLEIGPEKTEIKEKHIRKGDGFEWPNIIAFNQTIVSLLKDEKRILEIGSGTGCFAWHAAMDKSRLIVASEIDIKAKEWAKQNRPAENIQYVSKRLIDFEADSFDIVVSIDVIEHVKDYPTFLKKLSSLAPKAIITTPNKNRNEKDAKANSPAYYQHFREWTAGEFYWILKVFFERVSIYAMPNVYIPKCVPINITSCMTPIIAVCEKPRL